MTDSSPMAAVRRKRGPKPLLGEQPRDRIYDVALACFERHGIDATSMDDIARELGVSRPTMYNYFSSKHELVLEVVSRQAALVLAELPHRLTAGGLERVAEAAYLGTVASLDNPYVRLMIDGAATPLTGSAMAAPRVMDLQRTFWIPLLGYAREHHGLRTDRSLDDIMEWIIHFQFSLMTTGVAFELTREQMRERTYVYLLSSLREPPP